MQEHVTSAANEIGNALTAKAVVVTNYTTAGGLVVAGVKPELITQTTEFGKYLATNGIWVLSYTEIISIIGASYLVWQFSLSVYDRVISKIIWRLKNGKQARRQAKT